MDSAEIVSLSPFLLTGTLRTHNHPGIEEEGLMRRAMRRLWKLLGSDGKSRSEGTRPRGKSTVRLEILALEDRLVPTGTLTGMVSANAAVALQGIQVTLTGNGVNLSTTTDGQGDYAFRSLTAGTYQVTALAGGSLSQGSTTTVTVVDGQVTTQDLSTGGLAPGLVSLRDFLNTPIVLGGFGLPAAGTPVNIPPVVSNPIANQTLGSLASQTIDLAGVFGDPNLTNSQVVFQTSDGNMAVNLLDPQAPQTVANFFDYVNNARYDNTIFHRLDTNPPVLQGGGFGLQTSGGAVTGFSDVANASDPQLANEFSIPDTLGTLAMAKLSDNPNSATSEFFFNLANNSTTLGSSNNGGFTVFGSVASDATSQAVFNALQTPNTYNETTANSAFNVLPLTGYNGQAANVVFTGDTDGTTSTIANVSSVTGLSTGQSITGPGIAPGTTILTVGTNSITLSQATIAAGTGVTLTASPPTQTDAAFPGDTTPSNYLAINGVQVVKQDEALSYSVVSNSNPSVVGVQFVAGHPEVLQITSLGPSGTATITVQATTTLGASVQTTFQVTV
jgi:cyclophilin family peptidyl-prolyl cis-trans isomerase